MKILQVLPYFFLSKAEGKPVGLIYSLLKELVKRGNEVTLYTTDAFDKKNSRPKNFGEYLELDGIKIYEFGSLGKRLAYILRFSPSMIPAIKENIRSFDVVHLQEYPTFQNIIVHHYAKKYGIPYVLDAHGSIARMPERGRLWWLIRWLFDVAFGYGILRDASKVIAETEVGATEYEELGVRKGKIVVIGPPFATHEFSQLPPPGLFRRKYNIKHRHIILFLGRINWIKGLDFLIKSFYQLAQSKSDVILVIVGPDDGYKSTLERLINELSLSDKVLFTGFLDGDEKLSALVDADVVVQTSIYEQAARVPFEAILCNTPVIVSKNTGAGEDVKRIDAGYLVEYGNRNELKDMLQRILDNPAEAQRKTQRAKEYIKTNLSLEQGVGKYERLYADCMAAKEINHAE